MATGSSATRIRDEDAAAGHPLVDVRSITKAFPGVVALKDVSFDVRAGEVHALCGENGAGKSTLMKILAGNIRPDEGAIHFRGEDVHLRSPLDAKRRGILLVHQELSLVPDLSVAENILLGNLPTRSFGRVDRKALHARAAGLIAECGYDLQARDLVGGLSVARQQMVELVRASAFDCSVVIFDEPTAALTENEAEHLFANIERLKARGVAIVYISHKMKEIFRLSDRITVLRDGQTRGTLVTARTSDAEVTRLMIGRDLPPRAVAGARLAGEELLRIENLSVPGHVSDASLTVRAGEIVGLYGLIGAGRSEMMEAVFGLRRPSAGSIYWRGAKRDIASPRAAVELGMGLVPEDRKRQGLVLGLGCRDNMSLATLTRNSRFGFTRPGAEGEAYASYKERLRIKAATPATAVGTLSGGNQQKIVLGKWLATEPKLLILDEPTRGIDVGAKAEVHQLIHDLAARGIAIVLISSEMPEILGVSHRILVMYNGQLTAEFDGMDATEDRLIEAVMQPAERRAFAEAGRGGNAG